MQSFFNSLFVSAESSAARQGRAEGIKSDEIRYVIMTPPPNPKSAGITYLNELAQHLRDLGKKVLQLYVTSSQDQLYIWGSSVIPEDIHWLSPWHGNWIKVEPGSLATALNDERTVVIHGENHHHKWYDGLNVIRYYLHKIGALAKTGVPRNGEYKVAWHRMFCPDADFILRKSMVRVNLDCAEGLHIESRTLDLSYIGKGVIYDKKIKRIESTVELTRNWPNNDEEYFYLLSQARRLFTFDAATSVLDDAIVMGAMPVIMSTAPFSRVEWESNLEPEMRGCYCHHGDSYVEAQSSFAENRLSFLNSNREKNKIFKSELSKLCRAVETRFFSNSYKI